VRKWTYPLLVLPFLLSACDMTENESPTTAAPAHSLMDELPVGTVLFFDRLPPNPPPDGWEPCPENLTFVRIDRGDPGTPYPGKAATISGTTSPPTGDRTYRQDDTDASGPQGAGAHSVHTFSATLLPGQYDPTAFNFACLRKKS